METRFIPVADNGRMNLPADVRRKLGIQAGGKVVLEETKSGYRLTGPAERASRIKKLMQPYVGGKSMAEELIQERRNEGRRG